MQFLEFCAVDSIKKSATLKNDFYDAKFIVGRPDSFRRTLSKML